MATGFGTVNSNIAGIKSIILMKKGSFAAPTNLFVAGLRAPATMEMDYYNQTNDYRNRVLTRKRSFKLETKSYQTLMTDLKNFMEVFARDGGVDAQVAAEGLYTDVSDTKSYGGIFNFSGSNFFGLDFEFMIDNTERGISFTLENALQDLTAKNIIKSADTNTLLDISSYAGTNNPGGYLFGNVHPPFLTDVSIQETAGGAFTTWLNAENIIERKLSIKSKSVKNERTNRSRIYGLTVDLEITTDQSGVTDLGNFLDKTDYIGVQLTESLSDGSTDKYIFEINTLTNTKIISLGDEERLFKFKVSGDVSLYDYAFDTINQKLTFSI